MVHGLLKSKGLTHYYELRANHPFGSPVRPSSETFRYLDDPDLLEAYGVRPDNPELDFFLEGIQCVACLWLIEKLPEFVPGILNATLDMGRSVVTVRTKKGTPFSTAASMLDALGYRPHPLRRDESAEKLLKQENRTWLIRIGIAGAATMNIMLMAFSLYSGADAGFATAFQWISLALFVPVFFYAATPFYQSALRSLQRGSLSIDVPIALAIITGGAMSLWNLLHGSEHVYFDSLSALTFLLLASRFALRRLQQKSLSTTSLQSFLTPSRAFKRADDGTYEERSVESLKKGDWVRVQPGEVIPADGTIRAGETAINAMVLTGESSPVSAGPGSLVFAGTINEHECIDIEVSARGNDTRIGEILRQVESGQIQKSKIVTAADQLSRWFLLGVFALSGLAFYLGHDVSDGLSRALAMLIVTCPCALALATPLTMATSLRRAARHGIFLKDAETLERIPTLRNIFFDKTGTLTHGNYQVLVSELNPTEAPASIASVILGLETHSKHPVGRALAAWAKSIPGLPPVVPVAENIRSLPGLGITGVLSGGIFRIIRQESPEWVSPENEALQPYSTLVALFRGDEKLAEFSLGDPIRHDSPPSISLLRKKGIETFILSGDRAQAVKGVAIALGIEPNHAYSGLGPEEKKKVIDNYPDTLVIGDGANDAIALASADVGIAVHGSMEASLRAADIYFSKPGTFPLIRLFRLAAETRSALRRNFALSLAYNLAAAWMALQGQITPLTAAVIMPISALTVFVSSTFRKREALP